MIAAVASVLLAAAGDDGGLPPAVYADRAQLELDLPDGGVLAFPSECFADGDGGTSCGGGWLPTPRLEAHGGEVARLRTEVAALEATPRLFSPATWVFWGLALALGVALGTVGGWSLARLIDGR